VRAGATLPDAAVWVPPDLALLHAGLIDPGRLHPLVAAALAPHDPALAGNIPASGAGDAGRSSMPTPAGETGSPRQVEGVRHVDGVRHVGGVRHVDGVRQIDGVRQVDGVRLIECRGARHRIGIVGGVLSALDHDAGELRREAALVALGGMPLPCLRAIDLAGREPAELDDVRGRLQHGDTAGALAVVEGLLGAAAALPDGVLRDELDDAAARRVTHGLYRAGLAGRGPLKTLPATRRR
jgi:hypothetical protein